jgi:ribosomal protein S18 acetylase RimI-like enzyme
MDKISLTFEPEKSSLYVRPLEIDDLPICSQLDASYKTDYVWQMQFQEQEQAVQSAFTQVRLPRTMIVDGLYKPHHLLAILQQADHAFVAGYDEDIVGCLSGDVEVWQGVFTITTLIVHPQVRRMGIGKLLFERAKDIARQNECKRLLMTVQTKNHPAIEFMRKQGFVFCGYNDKYYLNGDIALIFSLNL